MATASAAFTLSGVIALVLAVFSGDVRLELGIIAALSGAIALGLLAVDRDREPESWPTEPQGRQPDPDRGHVLDRTP